MEKSNAENDEPLRLDDFMHSQKLLFDGYMRMQILNTLSDDFTKIVCTDVINLCYTFFAIKIKSLMEEHFDVLCEDDDNYELSEKTHSDPDVQIFVLANLCNTFSKGNEFWIAYKIIRMILSIKDEAAYHNQLNLILRN